MNALQLGCYLDSICSIDWSWSWNRQNARLVSSTRRFHALQNRPDSELRHARDEGRDNGTNIQTSRKLMEQGSEGDNLQRTNVSVYTAGRFGVGVIASARWTLKGAFLSESDDACLHATTFAYRTLARVLSPMQIPIAPRTRCCVRRCME